MSSDAALLTHYTGTRDADAFVQLVERYAGLVYGTCPRVTGNAQDAEDIAQECFLALAREAGEIRTSLAGWLHGVALRRSAMTLRSSSRRRRHEREAARMRPSEGDASEPGWEGIAPHIDQALAELPPDLREPLIRHYLQGRKQSDIAAALAVDQSTVSRRIETGLSELRANLRRGGVVASVALLATLLSQKTAVAVPSTLATSLGKMAMSGIGKAATASAASKAGVVGTIMGGGTMSKLIAFFGAALVVLLVAVTAVVIPGRRSSSAPDANNVAAVVNPPKPSQEVVKTVAFAAEQVTAQELLDKYRAALDSNNSYIIKSESHFEYDSLRHGKYKKFSGKTEKHMLTELRYDGERYYMRYKSWGSVYRNSPWTEDYSRYNSHLWDGKKLYSITGQKDSGGVVSIQDGSDRKNNSFFGVLYPGGTFLGFPYNESYRLDTILDQTRSISVRDKMEPVGGSDCYVIDAVTRYGKYMLWIDPEHGHHIAKARVRKGENDLEVGRKPLPKGVSVSSSLEVVRFEKVGDVWVPMEADMGVETHQPNGDFWNMAMHHRRTEVILNPDFDVLKSFVPDDIKDGAAVWFAGAPNVDYRWKDGKPVPESQ